MDIVQFAKLMALSASAYNTELNGQFKEAYSLHKSAISELKQLTQNLSSLSTKEREQKRIAKKKIDFHSERLEALRLSSIEGSESSRLLIPPSAATAAQSLSEEN